MTEEPENSTETEQEEPKEQTFHERVKESVDFIVDMMNSGKVNPDDVYPRGRYHGD